MEKNAGTFLGPHMLVMFVKGTRIHEGPRGGELSQFLFGALLEFWCLLVSYSRDEKSTGGEIGPLIAWLYA